MFDCKECATIGPSISIKPWFATINDFVVFLLTLIPTLIKVKRHLPSMSFYESHSHRRSRLSVSERTQHSITRYRSVNPATAGCSLQKPTGLFAYRSRGLET